MEIDGLDVETSVDAIVMDGLSSGDAHDENSNASVAAIAKNNRIFVLAGCICR